MPAGKYVLGFSGGVDSAVLFDILKDRTNLDIIVAHYDHGIRPNSRADRLFVEKIAKKNKKEFVTEFGDLGSSASEELARDARYDFLFKEAAKVGAIGVITAHHQDDVLETCFINIIRGTGRHGLSALKNRPGLYRPLLKISKVQLTDFANNNKVEWREDDSNSEIKYLRNKLRVQVLPNLVPEQRKIMLEIINNSEQLNNKIDIGLENLLNKGLHKGSSILNRRWFSLLPDRISQEVIYTILYKFRFGEIDQRTVDRLTVQIKTLNAGKTIQFPGGLIDLTKRSARFKKAFKKS